MLDMRIASRIVLPQSAGPVASTHLGALAITTGEGNPPGPLLWMVISINFNISIFSTVRCSKRTSLLSRIQSNPVHPLIALEQSKQFRTYQDSAGT